MPGSLVTATPGADRGPLESKESESLGMPILQPQQNIFPEDLLSSEAGIGAERRWWALYTRARQEKALARELVAHQIPFYLPLVPHTSLIRGRRVESLVPLFNGYVFIAAREEERVRTLQTNRVSQLITVEDQLKLQHDLRQLEQLIARRAPIVLESRLTPGRRVQVKSGPFMGIEGVVQRQRAGYRLLVEVSFLQQGFAGDRRGTSRRSIDLNDALGPSESPELFGTPASIRKRG